jgi:hypothetical protein
MKTLSDPFRTLLTVSTLTTFLCLTPLTASAAQYGDFTYESDGTAITITPQNADRSAHGD